MDKNRAKAYRDLDGEILRKVSKKQSMLFTVMSDRQRRNVIHTYTPSTIEEAESSVFGRVVRGSYVDRTSAPIKDGSVAETGDRDPSGYNSAPQWWIRINGRWVNTLGGCESDEDTQPIYGTEPKGGNAPCLALIDHVHGVPREYTNTDGTVWPEGTIMYVSNMGWARCDDMILSITHIMCPQYVDVSSGVIRL